MEAIDIQLSNNDLEEIKARTKKGQADVRIIKRALILKCRHMGMGTNEIVELLDVDPAMIPITLNNYLEFGLERTIEDAPRTGRPITFDDRIKSNIIAIVCSSPPEGYARWTLDLIKEECEKRSIVDSISRSSLQVILYEHELKPWREKMWCVPDLNDEYIQRMEDILQVYEKPYNENEPVVCLDEKPVALIEDKHERTSGRPGKVARKDYEYKRNGSANVFCAVEPLKGKYINKVTKNRKGSEFAKFLRSLSIRYSDVKRIILIMDNLNTHKKQSLIDFHGAEEADNIWSRFEIRYTPKHASWLNQAEIAIGMYSRQCLGDGRVKDIVNLKSMTDFWNKAVNKKRPVIQWEFTRKKSREKFNYQYDSS